MDLDGKYDELYDRLGFCGCGEPELALKAINELISHIELRNNYNGPFQGKDWDLYIMKINNNFDSFINNNKKGIEYILYYLLDDKEITEHGSSTPGWIADHDFRKKIKKFTQELEKEAI